VQLHLVLAHDDLSGKNGGVAIKTCTVQRTLLSPPHPTPFPLSLKLTAGNKVISGLESVSMTLANLPHSVINLATVSLGATRTKGNKAFDGFSLAAAIVYSLKQGYEDGVAATNCLTGAPCVYRPLVVGIKCDSPMVSDEGARC